MATTGADRVFLDTNVLVAATDRDRPSHTAALHATDGRISAGATVYLSGQVVREYLAVATRPMGVNGLGLSMAAALDNVARLLSRVEVLHETAAAQVRLLSLLADGDCAGKQVHDANIVATMLVHGVGTLVTENVAHFERFADLIEITPLR